jgi:hypothetical protein
MDNINLSQNVKREIGKIRRLYWIWYSDFIRTEVVSRLSQWRINNLVLQPGINPTLINMDVTGAKFSEEPTFGSNGPAFQSSIEFFSPSIDEFLESYLNEMIRRPVCLFVEDFEERIWLLGGQNPKTGFSFKKAIDGRNGYVFTFTNTSVESSLIINDIDFFPITPASLMIPWTDSDGTEMETPLGQPIVCTPGGGSSGLLLSFPWAHQWTSYEPGDTGYRLQWGWYSYIRTNTPEIVAQLDYSLGIDYFWRLKDSLKVGGNSNKVRFVDVDGLQNFGATGNKNKIVIDKLTGLGYYRILADLGGQMTWAAALDAALNFSVVVNGITYSDFYLPSTEEIDLITGHLWSANGSANLIDPLSFVPLISLGGNEEVWTSTTTSNNTANAYTKGWNSAPFIRYVAKTTSALAIPFLIFDASALISIP